jgi:perosamine synthetase
MGRVPVNEPLLDGNEKQYLEECIEGGWISSEGPFVKRFEEAFAKRVGRRHGIAVSSGSAALEAAVVALGIGPGDEVILPTFTIISCASAVVRAGARPVVVDCESTTWNINLSLVEEKITPRTKALMVVHIYGLPVDMDPLLEIAARHNLLVIEDAAEAHGQTYKERRCGAFGNISAFSFYSNKLVTTGEGGMLLTDDDGLADRCRSLRNLCFQPEHRFVHHELGWNMRMSNLQAAVGLAQTERLDESLLRKRHIGQLYTEKLRGTPSLQLPLEGTEYARNAYWVYGVVLGPGIPLKASDVAHRLAAVGIATRPFFWPMNKQPVFHAMGLFVGESCPVAETIAEKGFYLPSGVALTDDQITQVCEALRTVLTR